MFKGFTEKLKKRIEEYNQNSDCFTFCISDLEHSSDREEGKYKFNIHSAELRRKLGAIITSNGGTMSNPTAIKFGEAYELPQYLQYCGTKNHRSWIVINKAFLANLNKSNESRTILLPTKPLGFSLDDNTHRAKSDFKISSLTNMLYYGLVWHFGFDFRNEAYQIERAENEEREKHSKNIFKVSGDALKEINQTLAECSINVQDAEIDWPGILPNWCHCEVKELGNPENNILYRHHINSCLWREVSEINTFKDKVLAAIRNGKERFDDYKNSVIQKIIQKANSQGISEAELNNNRPNWQNTLCSLTNRDAITNYQTNQLEEDIKNLVAAKKKKTAEERQQAEAQAKENAKQEEERLKKEQETKRKQEEDEKKQKEKKEAEEKAQQEAAAAKERELAQKRTEFITNITTALNQEPKLTNNELSSQYQNWEEQINGITDLQQIANLQDRLLADIQARLQDKKTAEEIKENLKKAQTGTKEEKEQAWENLEKQETEKSYNDNKEEIEKLKKEKAAKDPQEYSDKAKQKLRRSWKVMGLKKMN